MAPRPRNRRVAKKGHGNAFIALVDGAIQGRPVKLEAGTRCIARGAQSRRRGAIIAHLQRFCRHVERKQHLLLLRQGLQPLETLRLTGFVPEGAV